MFELAVTSTKGLEGGSDAAECPGGGDETAESPSPLPLHAASSNKKGATGTLEADPNMRPIVTQSAGLWGSGNLEVVRQDLGVRLGVKRDRFLGQPEQPHPAILWCRRRLHEKVGLEPPDATADRLLADILVLGNLLNRAATVLEMTQGNAAKHEQLVDGHLPAEQANEYPKLLPTIPGMKRQSLLANIAGTIQNLTVPQDPPRAVCHVGNMTGPKKCQEICITAVRSRTLQR